MLVYGWYWLVICYVVGTIFGLAINGWIKTERENTLWEMLWNMQGDLFEAWNRVEELEDSENDKT